MNSVENRLRNASQPQPRRQLSNSFTSEIVAEIKTHPHAPKRENIFMKLRQKPAIVAAVLVAVIVFGGGTTYAATDGFTKPFNLSNIFGYKESKSNTGEQLVVVQLNDCSSAQITTQPQQVNPDRELMFRVKQGATETTDDLLKYVQGYCESYRQELNQQATIKRIEKLEAANVGPATMANNPAAEGNMTNTTGTIKAVSTSSLTMTYPYGEGDSFDVVYSKLSPKLVVEGPGATKLTDLQKGDTAFVIDRVGSDGSQTLLFVKRASGELAYYTALAQKSDIPFERVVKCDTDASGVCTLDTAPTHGAPQNYTPPKKTNGGSSDASTAIDDGVRTIQTAYQEYFQQPTAAGKEAFITKYADTPLATALRQPAPYDPIMCVQQGPVGLEFGDARTDTGTVTVTVYAAASAGIPKRALLDVTYSTQYKKITAIDCAQV